MPWTKTVILLHAGFVGLRFASSQSTTSSFEIFSTMLAMIWPR